MPRHAKALKFKLVYHKTKNPLGREICMVSSFQLFSYIIKVKYQEDQ